MLAHIHDRVALLRRGNIEGRSQEGIEAVIRIVGIREQGNYPAYRRGGLDTQRVIRYDGNARGKEGRGDRSSFSICPDQDAYVGIGCTAFSQAANFRHHGFDLVRIFAEHHIDIALGGIPGPLFLPDIGIDFRYSPVSGNRVQSLGGIFIEAVVEFHDIVHAPPVGIQDILLILPRKFLIQLGIQ